MLSKLLRLQPGASTCKCISCTTRSAVTRPIPGLPTKGNGRHTILFYSTIITTAAAADVTVKQNRRKELDTQIDELERSLHQADSSLTKSKYTTDRDTEDVWSLRSVTRRTTPRYITANNLDTKARQLDALRQLVFQEGGSEGCRPSYVSRTNTSTGSIYASDRVRQLRREWTPKKALTVEYAVAKLAARLMLTSPDICHERRSVLQRTLTDLNGKMRRLKQLGPNDTGGLERPSFPQYEKASQTLLDMTQKLNRHIMGILHKCADGVMSTSTMLTKITYNLLVSPVAPDITTFTKLIGRLSKLGLNEQVDAVIEALHDSHLRHDEMSVDTILCHYGRTNNLAGFHRYVLKVQGYYGGLQLGNPEKLEDDNLHSRFRVWNGKLIESVELDDRLYNTIVAGYNQFSFLNSADEWTTSMTQANAAPDVPVLLGPLSICVHGRRWKQGLRIWNYLERYLNDPEKAFGVRRADQQKAYHYMLNLCRHTNNLDHFRKIYAQALEAGFTMTELFLNTKAPPLPAREADHVEFRRRAVSVLMYRLRKIREDVRELSVYILADRIAQAGLSLQAVRDLFTERNIGNLYEAWERDRPWLNTGLDYCLKSILSVTEPTELVSTGIAPTISRKAAKRLRIGMRRLSVVRSGHYQRTQIVHANEHTSSDTSTTTNDLPDSPLTGDVRPDIDHTRGEGVSLSSTEFDGEQTPSSERQLPTMPMDRGYEAPQLPEHVEYDATRATRQRSPVKRLPTPVTHLPYPQDYTGPWSQEVYAQVAVG